MKRIKEIITNLDSADFFAMSAGILVGVIFGLSLVNAMTPKKPKPCSYYSEYRLYDIPARCIKSYLK